MVGCLNGMEFWRNGSNFPCQLYHYFYSKQNEKIRE